MTKRHMTYALVAVLLSGSVPVRGQMDMTARRDFESIAAQLDPGGELFLVLHAGRWIDRMLKTLAGGGGLPPSDADEQVVRDELEQVRRFLNRTGMSALRGVGVSSSAQRGGSHAVKLFVLRDEVDSNLPFWRGLFGWQPRRLMSLDFVPAGFSMVRAGTLEPLAVWGMLADAARETGGASSQVRFDQWRASATTWLGMPPEDLLGSLRDEFLVAVRFGKEATFVLPVGKGELTLPVPEVLIVVATGENVLRGVVEAHMARLKITLVESVVAGMPMRQAESPLEGMPFPVQPALASAPGFLLLGSSPGVVEEALLAYRHRNGLVTRPDFLSAFQGLSMINNGILYVDADGARVLQHWRESRLDAEQGAGDAQSPAMSRIARALATGGEGLPTCALVVRNWKHGVMINGFAGVGGEVLLRSAAAAAMAIWNGSWSRETARGTER